MFPLSCNYDCLVDLAIIILELSTELLFLVVNTSVTVSWTYIPFTCYSRIAHVYPHPAVLWDVRFFSFPSLVMPVDPASVILPLHVTWLS